MIDWLADRLLSTTAHKHAAVFWLGPGMILSVLLSVMFGNIVSLIYVGVMSAYANFMLHLIEWHQGKEADKVEN